ncbi:bifunctional hydroxyethylthiazole kinase/thiamine-phosphate diphosphorylase [Sugiyamaella lignohabitans]|uniref:Bifunctional hydroxyethylthiazole kinase/thiamine-phosphate diphosphorylase n=1 Tax=Sugiyamaella lignohabitans TaxID=796027 RepID=A0A167D4I6_9ASCO|nr:bifunctional hydroxyethylthiazole kinase/thiamine-phosphate diphosphorylase [Sugiyamaella lignohabitans]ANB12469.1 bifunctional hydroxyethylthiazole kinase/thiamine-phosphate diphosphorylase [Sugiyamaella lignohabitans]
MSIDKKVVDYSVYLVTDSSLVPESSSLVRQVEEAIRGGATIVQLREKEAETRDFIEIGKKIHELTRKAGIPLIINDRLDVVLALDAEGIHVGQDDMDIPTIRKHLGPEKIIGVSVSNIEEARQARVDDVDYVGIGAVFGTQTKNLKKSPMGTGGVSEILMVLNDDEEEEQSASGETNGNKLARRIQSVAIGGINQSNAESVIKESFSAHDHLDGVAVVSCIIGAEDAFKATKQLKETVVEALDIMKSRTIRELLAATTYMVAAVAETSPFVHHMTNTVVTNFSANMTITVGASPAMSECVEEFDDFAKIPNSSLLINMGTATFEGLARFQAGMKAYYKQNRRVVLDPVGAGASQHRKNVLQQLLELGGFAVIKGNEGEITAAAGVEGAKVRGVDSVGSESIEKRFEIVEKLASTTGSVVLMTGEEDVLVHHDKKNTRKLLFRNGHEYLSKITGSGCVLGSLVTAFSACFEDAFLATGAALLLYTIASERAVETGRVHGPGSFVPALIDQIYQISQESQNRDSSWISRAKVYPY